MASSPAAPPAPANPERPHDSYAALRLPMFRRYIAGLATLTFATQVQGTVVGWQVYAVTRDPLSLGVLGYYVSQLYEEQKGRPIFVVREARGSDTLQGSREPPGG